MIICRSTPQYPGRYACYLPGVAVATVIREFRDGVWFYGGEPVAGKVEGWIGPLPAFPENSVNPPKQDFDL